MAGPSKIDFFGFYVDRAAVATPLAAGVAAAKAAAASEEGLIERVGDLLIGKDRLKGFLKGVADRFADALSLTAPGLTGNLTADAVPGNTLRRTDDDLGPLGLGVLSHLFDREPILPVLGGLIGGTPGNRINRVEVRVLQGLASLANLSWGFFDDANAAMQKRLQQLRVYFVEFYQGRFKDRNGNALPSPGKGIDPFHLTPRLTGQLAHVLVEFTGDAAYRVPVKPADGAAQTSYTCTKAGVIEAAIQNIRLNGAADGKDFSHLVADVVEYAGRHAESATRAQFGSLIRGGGMAGINNEAVAEAITAAIGGLVKKSSEKIAFETLKAYITSPTADAATRDNVLAVLDYLHRNGPKPAGFLA